MSESTVWLHARTMTIGICTGDFLEFKVGKEWHESFFSEEFRKCQLMGGWHLIGTL